MGNRLSERFHIVPIFQSADVSSATTGDSINVRNVQNVMFLVMSTTTNWGAGPDITVKSGATDGAETTAVTVYYRYGSAATGSASADILSAWASGTSVAMGDTHEGYLYIVEVDMADITDGHDWLTCSLDADASAAGEATCVAVIEPRYAQDAIPTALA
jgi:hypothetical protein